MGFLSGMSRNTCVSCSNTSVLECDNSSCPKCHLQVFTGSLVSPSVYLSHCHLHWRQHSTMQRLLPTRARPWLHTHNMVPVFSCPFSVTSLTHSCPLQDSSLIFPQGIIFLRYVFTQWLCLSSCQAKVRGPLERVRWAMWLVYSLGFAMLSLRGKPSSLQRSRKGGPACHCWAGQPEPRCCLAFGLERHDREPLEMSPSDLWLSLLLVLRPKSSSPGSSLTQDSSAHTQGAAISVLESCSSDSRSSLTHLGLGRCWSSLLRSADLLTFSLRVFSCSLCSVCPELLNSDGQTVK